MLDLSGTTALVTGASRGIGAACAKALAARGAQVVLLAKTAGALEEIDDEIQAAGGQPATLVPLDLKDMEGIDRLGGALYQRFGKLDILVAAAGVLGDLMPLTHIPPKQWDGEIAVNLSANWRLLRSFDPLLREAPAARAVFFSSGAARTAKAYWGAYSIAKAGLEKLVEIYAEEVKNISAVKANIINPGPMRTELRASVMPGEDPMSLPHPDEIVPLLEKLVDPALSETGQLFNFRDFVAAKH
ncbi:MAG: SDR family NAD(P)-dependent oxidoreductase [Pseudomonadota bacterium]